MSGDDKKSGSTSVKATQSPPKLQHLADALTVRARFDALIVNAHAELLMKSGQPPAPTQVPESPPQSVQLKAPKPRGAR